MIRLLSRNKLLLYPDEKPDYVLPHRYRLAGEKRSNSEDPISESDDANITHPRAHRTDSGNANAFHDAHLAPNGEEAYGRSPSEDSEATLVLDESLLTRQGAAGMEPKKVRELMQDPNIVTWYGVDDEENPINW